MSRELAKVRQQLKRLLDTEALTQELRSGKKFDQAQWNELKVMVWTRLLSSVYALALLQLKLRTYDPTASSSLGYTADVSLALLPLRRALRDLDSTDLLQRLVASDARALRHAAALP